MSDLFTVNSTDEPGVFEVDVPEPTETPVDFHTPFLERASDPDGEDSQHALGAFLTLRIVDQFAKSQLNAVGLGYQISSAFGYLADLSPRTDEVECLEAIAHASQAALRQESTEALFVPLRRYAEELEGQLRLDEAVDVLNTILRVPNPSDHHVVHLFLQRGRVLRVGGRFSSATESYAAAGKAALRHGDTHAELLSRIGRAIVLQFLGNLPAAQQLLHEVRTDAVRLEDRDAEARATHDLAVTASKRNDNAESVKYAFRAFQLYDGDEHKRRALADLGTALQALGHYSAASDAFEIVLSGHVPTAMRIATTLELIELATHTGNRMMFEKRRREIETLDAELPPSSLVDFKMKVGKGLASFGNTETAKKYLRRAVQHAEEYNLNDFLFKAEAALDDLNETPPQAECIWPAEEKFVDDVVSVARELQLLRAAV